MIAVEKINDTTFDLTMINQYFPEYENIICKL